MASTDVGTATSSGTAELGTIDMGLEVVTLPVSDVDRAKSFYQSLGWRLDIDLVVSDDIRTVQFTPPHSGCSIQFGKGGTTAEPGSADRGCSSWSTTSTPPGTISSAAASTSARWRRRGPRASTAEGRSYFARRRSATRMATAGRYKRSRPGSPAANGRTEMDVATLSDLLRETAEHHGSFEAVAPPHDWWDWYAAYMDARGGRKDPG